MQGCDSTVEILGTFGDLRLNSTGGIFFNRILKKGHLKINRLSKNRAEQVKFQRFIWNDKVTVKEMEKEMFVRTSEAAKNVEHVLAIQDSSELNFDKRRNEIKDLGVVKNNKAIGLFIHPVLAVDAKDNFVIGLAANKMWSWDPKRKKMSHYEKDCLPIHEKESYRWIECAQDSKKVLSQAKMVTFISDRESDIYQLFAEIPDAKTHVIVRCKADRCILINERQSTLSKYIKNLKVADQREILLKKQTLRHPSAQSVMQKCKVKPKTRKERNAVLDLRFGPVQIVKPQCADKTAPATLNLWVVDVIENKKSKNNKEKIHWRIITSHPINTQEEAWNIIDLYRKRWMVEQYFRAAKRCGLNLEEIESTRAAYIEKMVFIGLLATVKILQLTYGRDYNVQRPAENLFTKLEIKILHILNKEYQGKTKAQKNPYRKNSIPWAYWIIGRHGGWKGYNSSGPAGPAIIKYGLDEFQKLVGGHRFFPLVCIT